MKITLHIYDDEVTGETFAVSFDMPYQEQLMNAHHEALTVVKVNTIALLHEGMSQLHRATADHMREAMKVQHDSE